MELKAYALRFPSKDIWHNHILASGLYLPHISTYTVISYKGDMTVFGVIFTELTSSNYRVTINYDRLRIHRLRSFFETPKFFLDYGHF